MKQNFRIWSLFLIPFTVLVLAACSSDGDKKPDNGVPDRPVEEVYNEAADLMDKKEFKNAQKKFEDVERLYPYSAWATQAQMMGAYAAYQDLRYDEAVLALDRFIELHPSNEKIDYVLYLKALCFYEQISDVTRDQAMTQQALDSLGALIARYPDSPYTKEAKLKRDLTLDHLAGKEMEIGRYYLTRGEYNAAINRFVKVVRDYQTTTHTPEALHRLVESYVSLGLIDQAIKVAAVLGHNFPGSKWYQDSYELLDPAAREKLNQNRGFLNKTIESILKPS
jgi:outer membrane protein assembly factor BamD